MPRRRSAPASSSARWPILNNKPRSATATCAEDCRLLVIDPKTFEAMIRGNAEIAVRMIKKLADRLQEADEQIENLLLPRRRLAGGPLPGRRGRARRRRSRPAIEDRRWRRASWRRGGGQAGAGRRGPAEAAQGQDRRRRRTTGFVVPDVAKLRHFLEFLQMKAQFGERGVRLRVLGCSGGELPRHRTTCFLVDGGLAIDAGALTASLSLEQLLQVDDIVLTHSHFDHVKDVPLLADLLVGRRRRPVRVHASTELRPHAARERLQRPALARLHPHPRPAPAGHRAAPLPTRPRLPRRRPDASSRCRSATRSSRSASWSPTAQARFGHLRRHRPDRGLLEAGQRRARGLKALLVRALLPQRAAAAGRPLRPPHAPAPLAERARAELLDRLKTAYVRCSPRVPR